MIFDITKRLARIAKVVSGDPTRRNISGVCFRDGKAYATNGMIVAISTAPQTEDMFPSPAMEHRADEYIVPPWVLEKMDFTKSRPIVHLECTENLAEARYDQKLISDELIKKDGEQPVKFPDVESLLKKESPLITVRLNAELFKWLYDLAKGDTGSEYIDLNFYPGEKVPVVEYETSNEFRGMVAPMNRYGADEVDTTDKPE
jgi:hypothetical protein